MKELFELFNEMVSFEVGMKQDTASGSIDAELSRQVFKQYSENRFNEIYTTVSESSNWLEAVQQLKCA